MIATAWPAGVWVTEQVDQGVTFICEIAIKVCVFVRSLWICIGEWMDTMKGMKYVFVFVVDRQNIGDSS